MNKFDARYTFIFTAILIFSLAATLTDVKAQSQDSRDDSISHSQYNRYIFSTTALPGEKGQFLYINNQVFLSSLSYYVSPYLSLTAGTAPFFLGGQPFPVYFKPEMRLPPLGGIVHFSAGTYAVTVIGRNEGVFGIAFAKASVGKPDMNASLSVGKAWDELGFQSGVVFGINGFLRISRSFGLVTENFYVPDDFVSGWFSINALRYVPGRASMDFGLMFVNSGNVDNINIDVLPIPYLGVSIPF